MLKCFQLYNVPSAYEMQTAQGDDGTGGRGFRDDDSQ